MVIDFANLLMTRNRILQLGLNNCAIFASVTGGLSRIVQESLDQVSDTLNFLYIF